MKRLTERLKTGDVIMAPEYEEKYTAEEWIDVLQERLAAYEDTGLTPEGVEALKLSMMGKAITEIKEFNGLPVARLRELAEADKDGRVVVLPCKMGDTVYILRRTFDGADVVGEAELWWTDIPQLGKTVFLTREEAEKALEGEGK